MNDFTDITVDGTTYSRAYSWGLFDGFNDRPKTVAGLIGGNSPGTTGLDFADYRAGYSLGAKLRRGV